MGSTEQALEATVGALCAPETAGRLPGSPAGRNARAVVSAAMDEVGLEPGSPGGFEQPIGTTGGANVLGVLPGDEGRWLLLAAHYDHLGQWGDEVFWGANDNASGVAVILEVAKRLAGRDEPLGRSVLFCGFDAEEPPAFLTPEMGSQWFVDHPTIPLDRVDLMVCLDIVGTALGPGDLPPAVAESIFVQGAETSAGTVELISGLPDVAGVRPRHLPDWLIPPMSDHDAFRNAGIPWVFYTVGRDARYHTTADTPEHLDLPKMAALVTHLEQLIIAAAGARGPRTYLARPASDLRAVDDLVDVLAALAGVDDEAAAGLQLLREVRDQHTDGYLGPQGRAVVQAIVFTLEERLGEL